MDNYSFIKLNRQILEWEWYTDANTLRLFLHCLLKANYKDKKWQGITIKRGSFITSLDHLAKDLSLSVQQIRTSLIKLESTNEITKKSNRKHTVIQVVKYNTYQSITNKTTNEQQTDNKQVTTTKEKKERKETYREFKHLSLSLSEFEALKEEYTKEQIDDMLDSIENFKNNTKYTSLNLTVRKWLKKEYPKSPKKEGAQPDGSFWYSEETKAKYHDQ